MSAYRNIVRTVPNAGILSMIMPASVQLDTQGTIVPQTLMIVHQDLAMEGHALTKSMDMNAPAYQVSQEHIVKLTCMSVCPIHVNMVAFAKIW
jgi:hypothetical protein